MPANWDGYSRATPSSRCRFGGTRTGIGGSDLAVLLRLHSGEGTSEVSARRSSWREIVYALETEDIFEKTRAVFSQQDRVYAREVSDYFFEFARIGPPARSVVRLGRIILQARIGR